MLCPNPPLRKETAHCSRKPPPYVCNRPPNPLPLPPGRALTSLLLALPSRRVRRDARHPVHLFADSPFSQSVVVRPVDIKDPPSTVVKISIRHGDMLDSCGRGQGCARRGADSYHPGQAEKDATYSTLILAALAERSPRTLDELLAYTKAGRVECAPCASLQSPALHTCMLMRCI